MAAEENSPQYSWDPEHEGVLAKLADTNVVQNEWKELREMLKFKITENVEEMAENVIPFEKPGIPSTFDPTDEVLNLWTQLPAFPPRPATLPPVEFPLKVLPKDMTKSDAHKKKEYIFQLLDDFEDQPPFTIQRLAELALRPREHFNAVGKYLRALERSLTVTSGWNEYRLDTYTATTSNGTAVPSHTNPFSYTSTPLFSPIPFLHPELEATERQPRSRSTSPTSTLAGSPLSLDGRRPLPGDDLTDPVSSSSSLSPADENVPPGGGGMSPAMIRQLRVDELDHISPPTSPTGLSATFVPSDPSSLLSVPSSSSDDLLGVGLTGVGSPTRRLGHLADHPEAFSSTTTTTTSGTVRPNSGGGGLGLALSPPPSSGSPVRATSPSSPSAPRSPTATLRSGAPSPSPSLTLSAAGVPTPTPTPPLSDRFVRESTPEPSPSRGLAEVEREKAAAEAEANAAAESATTVKEDEVMKVDDENAPGGDASGAKAEGDEATVAKPETADVSASIEADVEMKDA
ncbi:hypothetical protein DL93DRAFT_2090381 [Clavulina sp. PMI_390]|nr:hypothetical protein DL93DRAFT_2090381 [Clavulina sp. PMI_390]